MVWHSPDINADVNKHELRQQAKAIRDAIPKDVRDMAANNLALNLNAVIPQSSHIVGTYYPFKSEIKPPHLIAGKSMSLPVIRSGQTLEFYEWNENEPLVKRDFDIPIPDTRDKSSIRPDVLIMPLLMADVQGNRIGYGAGHYDRYIDTREIKPLLIGVCFEEQIYDGIIPHEPHDQPLDLIVTPKRVIEIEVNRHCGEGRNPE
jgi:5-formyltetrahydrofolate cyclo-ligase